MIPAKRIAVFAVVLLACGAVQGTQLSRAPLNACSEHPCELYAPGKTTKVTCSSGRCEISGRPDFDFTIVTTAPTNASYGAGFTFSQTSDALFAPKNPRPGCPKVTCLELPSLYEVVGSFHVASGKGCAQQDSNCDSLSHAFGYPIAENLSVPVRTRYIPRVTAGDLARDVGLPLSDLLASSRNTDAQTVAYGFSIAAGKYRRTTYPEAPYDAFVPPTIEEVEVPDAQGGQVAVDERLVLRRADDDPAGIAQLDDPSGESRTAHISRTEGLDGFRIWIADSKTGERVSVVKTLKGTTDTVRLATAGQNAGSATALRDFLDVVIAPPDGWIAAPRLVSTLIGGSGLGGLVYPSLPAPAGVNGVVATRTDQGLTGIPAQVTFTSTSLAVTGGTVASPLLHYTTTVATDDRGRFATVVPPGTYEVVLEPAEGTGYGKVKKVLEVAHAIAPTLEPPKRSAVTGRLVLTDGRPLASATVMALPSHEQVDASVVPRPGRAVSGDDGRFALSLDQGRYDVTVIPEAGTGYPRVVTVRAVGSDAEDLGFVSVPAPMKVQFTVRAPARSGGDAIPGALVRFFASPASGGAQIEVGSALTDAQGRCEILLAQEPR